MLWQRFLQAQRHLEGTTAEDYDSYGEFHLLPFFGAQDLAVIKRSRPLREADARPATPRQGTTVRHAARTEAVRAR